MDQEKFLFVLYIVSMSKSASKILEVVMLRDMKNGSKSVDSK